MNKALLTIRMAADCLRHTIGIPADYLRYGPIVTTVDRTDCLPPKPVLYDQDEIVMKDYRNREPFFGFWTKKSYDFGGQLESIVEVARMLETPEMARNDHRIAYADQTRYKTHESPLLEQHVRDQITENLRRFSDGVIGKINETEDVAQVIDSRITYRAKEGRATIIIDQIAVSRLNNGPTISFIPTLIGEILDYFDYSSGPKSDPQVYKNNIKYSRDAWRTVIQGSLPEGVAVPLASKAHKAGFDLDELFME
ncbi:hypothetical protein HZB02_02120 [Candidatus Woesearchaeota archaeon]|nr:hypothetical protein [Candidatus Woesearchaeota archaeon]